jgi:4-hydroxybenzoate polyprenyltransferase
MRNKVTLSEAITASRPLWWVTMVAPFIAGSLLAEPTFSWLLLVGIWYFLFPYNLLVYGVNDIFDYETDIRNERKNSLAHGRVMSKLKHPSLWRWIAWVNAVPIVVLVLAGNTESNIFLLMIIFMAFAYSATGLRYKEIPVIDSLTSAFHYASPFIFGSLLFEGNNLWVGGFAAFYFWAVGNHAYGAIQDIVPDKAAGVSSVATKFGASGTICFVVVAYSLAVIAPVLSFGYIGGLAGLCIAPYFIAVAWSWRFRKDPNHPAFKQLWRRFLYYHYVIGAFASIVLIYLYKNAV